MNIPKGTFVVFGPEHEPVVITLSEPAFKLHYDREMIVSSAKAVGATFGEGFETAVPAWVEASLEPLALGYEGAHQLRIRAICAALVLGMPLEELFRRKTVVPPKPKSDDDGAGARVVVPVSSPPPSGVITP